MAKNLEKNKPVTLTMTSEGLATLLPAFLPAIKKLIQDKHPRVNPVLTLVQKPNKILIENKKASTSITVRAKAPGFDKNIELKFTLDNTSSENELKFSEITVDPGKIMFLIDLQGEVRTALSALTVNQILKDALQEQLATVKSDIVIDKIDMSFTSDNKLQITLAGQKKEPQKTA